LNEAVEAELAQQAPTGSRTLLKSLPVAPQSGSGAA
jgi:hypothetical protein